MNELVATIPAIMVICFGAGVICKAFTSFPDKYIPVVVLVLGGVLGAIGMYVIPDFPAKDVINAIAVGVASGAASTGVHQVFKQLKKSDLTDYSGIDYSDDMYWDDENDDEEGGNGNK